MLRIILIGVILSTPCFAQQLPDPEKTPGVALSGCTREIICAKEYTTRDVRSVTAGMKKEIYFRYKMYNHKGNCAKSKRGCEVDHLISLELCGANDLNNLWPQSFGKPWGAEVKDRLENKLHQLVCSGAIDLETAQKEISSDWTAAYRKYIK